MTKRLNPIEINGVERNAGEMTTAALKTGKTLTTSLVQYRQTLNSLAMIAAGCLVFAYGMKAVMIPAQLFCGGLTGLAVIVAFFRSGTDIGLIYLLLNTPLIILGWFAVSRRFIAYTLYGTIVFSAISSCFNPTALRFDDPLLAVVVAGVICGLGSGLILKSYGSAGGLDILAVFLHKRYGIHVATTCFSANVIILLIGLFCYETSATVYSILLLYISSRVINTVIYGFNSRVAITIISDSAEVISHRILAESRGGVTFLQGRGGFSELPKQVILSVAAKSELPKIKDIIRKTDPGAFVIVNDTQEVLGLGHGSLQTY
jgi:uncharacterized membrane-anchored protein YitT (DUF2179 family)